MGHALKLTYADYALTPEGTRYELLEGELHMTPAPNTLHQRISRAVFDLIEDWVKKKSLGEVFYSPIDVLLSRENVVQPDLLFISTGRRGIISERGVEGPPDLVVEILSPSTRNRDVDLKHRLYAQYGVREYWIVDPQGQTVEVAALKEQNLSTLNVHPEGASVLSPTFPGLSFDPKLIFCSYGTVLR